MEQAARQRRSRGCARNEGHQVGVGEEPEGPDPGAAGLVGVAVQDQLGPVPGVPAQGATPAGVLDQGRNRPGTARRGAGLGPTLAAPRVRHTRRHDQTVPAADLQHPRSGPVQRTLGSHEHAPTSTDQTCQRIPHTRSVHRHGHAHPRRPVPGAAKPPMKTAGGPKDNPAGRYQQFLDLARLLDEDTERFLEVANWWWDAKPAFLDSVLVDRSAFGGRWPENGDAALINANAMVRVADYLAKALACLLYTSPSPR